MQRSEQGQKIEDHAKVNRESILMGILARTTTIFALPKRYVKKEQPGQQLERLLIQISNTMAEMIEETNLICPYKILMREE